MKRMMNKAKTELSNELKKHIKSEYDDAAKKVGVPEVVYVLEKIRTKSSCLENSNNEIMYKLGLTSKIFYKVLIDCQEKKIKLDDKTYKMIVAALFYLINPYDVIPDYESNTGYLDDAYVMGLCVKMFSRKEPESYQCYFKEIL